MTASLVGLRGFWSGENRLFNLLNLPRRKETMQKYLHLEWGIEPQSPTWKVRALSIQPLDLGRGVDFNGVLIRIMIF